MKIRTSCRSQKVIWVQCLIFLLPLLLVSGSFAQEQKQAEEYAAGQADLKWTTYIRGGYVHQFSTDLDRGGEFKVNRLFIQPGITYEPDDHRSFSLTFGYGYDGYDFKGNSGFAALQPWDDIHSFRLSTPMRFRKGDQWSYFFIPTIRFVGESSADWSDSLSGGGFAGFAYRFSEHLTIGPGLGVITQIEDEASIFPVLIIKWKITDTISLETGRGLGATLGPGISMIWRVSEQFSLTLGGRYEKLRFRLDDRAKSENGIGQDKSFPLFGSITYNPERTLRISLFGGIETAGELQLEDSEGNFLDKDEYDSAAFVGITFSKRF